MSWVATSMLSVDILEDRALVEDFSEWLRTEAPRREPPGSVGVGFLESLSDAPQGWGGWKNRVDRSPDVGPHRWPYC